MFAATIRVLLLLLVPWAEQAKLVELAQVFSFVTNENRKRTREKEREKTMVGDSCMLDWRQLRLLLALCTQALAQRTQTSAAAAAARFKLVPVEPLAQMGANLASALSFFLSFSLSFVRWLALSLSSCSLAFSFILMDRAGRKRACLLLYSALSFARATCQCSAGRVAGWEKSSKVRVVGARAHTRDTLLLLLMPHNISARSQWGCRVGTATAAARALGSACASLSLSVC